jgi:hypothetical protein
LRGAYGMALRFLSLVVMGVSIGHLPSRPCRIDAEASVEFVSTSVR